jgi:hypothetical protein
MVFSCAVLVPVPRQTLELRRVLVFRKILKSTSCDAEIDHLVMAITAFL